MRVLVTRPQLDGERVLAVLAARGVEGLLAPLLDIDYLDAGSLDIKDVQAVLFTSTNGVRAFAKCCEERSILALCVGERTAVEAKAENFSSVKSANGNVEDLVALVKETLHANDGALLHPAGTNVAGDLASLLQAAGYSYRREVLYSAHKAQTLPEPIVRALTAGDLNGVLLYSPRTAQAFSKLVMDGGLGHTLDRVTAYCLSPAVADAIVDLPWKTIKIADHPNQDALLALL
jgi:uroporphyrinogen-III synthase